MKEHIRTVKEGLQEVEAAASILDSLARLATSIQTANSISNGLSSLIATAGYDEGMINNLYVSIQDYANNLSALIYNSPLREFNLITDKASDKIKDLNSK